MIRYCILALDGRFRETAPQAGSFFRRETVLRHDQLLARVRHIAASSKIERVYVRVGPRFSVESLASAESIARLLCRLRDSGKQVHFYATEYRDVELYLAAHCTHRHIHPLGTVGLAGVARSFLFVRRLLDELRVSVEVARRSEYKGAGDRFSRERIDANQTEQYAAYLECVRNELAEAIRSGYGKTEADLLALEQRILDADEALRKGWTDRVLTWRDMTAELAEAKARRARLPSASDHYGRGKRIAVLYLEGTIRDGTSRQSPLYGQSIGSDSFCSSVEKLRKDRSVAAVVLRVSSPGGTATAAEDIRRELSALAEKKPVLVSFGHVAASGGYWVSCLGRPVLTQRTTLTGSIGVVSVLFRASGLLGSVGVTVSHLSVSGGRNRLSPFLPVTAETRSVLDEMIEPVYRRFLDLVGTSRNMGASAVESRAGGRVYSGRDAISCGLADAEGDLWDAIELAAREVEARRVRIEFRPRIHKSFLQRIIDRRLPTVAATEPAAAGDLAEILSSVATELPEVSGRPLVLLDSFLTWDRLP